jgi:hypothetical protein
VSERLGSRDNQDRRIRRIIGGLVLLVGGTSVAAYYHYQGKDDKHNVQTQAAIDRHFCANQLGRAWDKGRRTPLMADTIELARDTLYYYLPDEVILENPGLFKSQNPAGQLNSNLKVHQPVRAEIDGTEWIGFKNDEPTSASFHLSCLNGYVWVDFTAARKGRQAVIYPPAETAHVEFGTIHGSEVVGPDGQRAAYAQQTRDALPGLFVAASQ